MRQRKQDVTSVEDYTGHLNALEDHHFQREPRIKMPGKSLSSQTEMINALAWNLTKNTKIFIKTRSGLNSN